MDTKLRLASAPGAGSKRHRLPASDRASPTRRTVRVGWSAGVFAAPAGAPEHDGGGRAAAGQTRHSRVRPGQLDLREVGRGAVLLRGQRRDRARPGQAVLAPLRGYWSNGVSLAVVCIKSSSVPREPATVKTTASTAGSTAVKETTLAPAEHAALQGGGADDGPAQHVPQDQFVRHRVGQDALARPGTAGDEQRAPRIERRVGVSARSATSGSPGSEPSRIRQAS